MGEHVMPQRAFGFLLAMLVAAGALTLAAPNEVGSPRAGNMIYVDDDGLCGGATPCFRTIQLGVAAASSGDTVYVFAGAYGHTIMIVDMTYLTLQGEDRDTTIIDCEGWVACMILEDSQHVTITNFTMFGATYGIQDYTSSGSTTISYCNFSDMRRDAVWLQGIGGSLLHNTINRSGLYGIDIVSDFEVLDNTISNSWLDGIWAAGSNNMSRNVIRGSGRDGLHLMGGDSTVTFNAVDGNQGSGIYAGGMVGLVHDNSFTNNTNGVFVEGGGVFEFNVISNNSVGVYVKYGSNAGVRNNTISGNKIGVYHSSSYGATRITGNEIARNEEGIHVTDGDYLHIAHNRIIQNAVQASDPDLKARWEDWTASNGWEGNYWSDYRGLDNGAGVGKFGEPRKAGDGVGDTNVPHLGLDWYPLMDHGSSNNPPLADAGGPYMGSEGAAIVFDGSLSSDIDGDPLQFRWDFDDDGLWDTPWSQSPTASRIWGDDWEGRIALQVSDGDLTETDTANVTILNLRPSVDTDITATVTGNLTLRVAGEKWHDVALTVYRDGVAVANASVVRAPGSPDDQSATIENVTIDLLGGNLSAVVRYTPDDDPINGRPNGANPAWLIFTARDGSESRLHHTFNVRHNETWIWKVDELRVLLVGTNITFIATATDPGSDDLTFTWDWGDGTPATATTHFNDATAPDPYPSPCGTFPFTATDSEAHAYQTAGIFELKLTVRDDDGGTTEIPLVVVIV